MERTNSKRGLSRREAAESLGCGLAMLDQFLKRSVNPLPSIRAGRKVIISAAALDEWLKSEAARQAAGR